MSTIRLRHAHPLLRKNKLNTAHGTFSVDENGVFEVPTDAAHDLAAIFPDINYADPGDAPQRAAAQPVPEPASEPEPVAEPVAEPPVVESPPAVAAPEDDLAALKSGLLGETASPEAPQDKPKKQRGRRGRR